VRLRLGVVQLRHNTAVFRRSLKTAVLVFALRRWAAGVFVFALKRRAADVRPPWLSPHKRRRPVGPAALRAEEHPSIVEIWCCNGAWRRKADGRPQRCWRSQRERGYCGRAGERLRSKRAKVTGMRFDAAAVPATVSGEYAVRAPLLRGAATGAATFWEGERRMR